MDLPQNVYPIFANALRSEKSQSSKEHLKECSELFSKFSKVAEKKFKFMVSKISIARGNRKSYRFE